MTKTDKYFDLSLQYRLTHGRFQEGCKLARVLCPLYKNDSVVVSPAGFRPEWGFFEDVVSGCVCEFPLSFSEAVMSFDSTISDLEEYLNEKIYVTINTGGRAGETFQVSRKHLSLSNSPCVNSLFSTMISDTDVHPIKRANGQIASLRELALDTALKKCIRDMKRGLRSDIAHFKYPTYTDECTFTVLQNLFAAQNGVVGQLIHSDERIRTLLAYHIFKTYAQIHHILGCMLFAFTLQTLWHQKWPAHLVTTCYMFSFLEAVSACETVITSFVDVGKLKTEDYLRVMASALKVRDECIREGGDAVNRLNDVFPSLPEGVAFQLHLSKNANGDPSSSNRAYMLKHHGPTTGVIWAMPSAVDKILQALNTKVRFQPAIMNNGRLLTAARKRKKSDGCCSDSSHSEDE